LAISIRCCEVGSGLASFVSWIVTTPADRDLPVPKSVTVVPGEASKEGTRILAAA
jgi:hypothetical protein